MKVFKKIDEPMKGKFLQAYRSDGKSCLWVTEKHDALQIFDQDISLVANALKCKVIAENDEQ